MKYIIATSSLAVALTLPTGRADAQTISEIAGWGGLMVTPVGALTPMGPAIAADTAPYRFQMRYGHWQFDTDDDNTHNLGLGIGLRTGHARTTFEFGYSHKTDCSGCNSWMLGADVDIPLTPAPSGNAVGWRIALNPALGFAKPSDGSGSAASAAVSLPVSAALPMSQWILAPFVSPGYGYGRLSGDGDSEGGTRAMLAGGVTLASTQSQVRVTFSARKIFLEHAPTVFGLGFSFAP